MRPILWIIDSPEIVGKRCAPESAESTVPSGSQSLCIRRAPHWRRNVQQFSLKFNAGNHEFTY